MRKQYALRHAILALSILCLSIAFSGCFWPFTKGAEFVRERPAIAQPPSSKVPKTVSEETMVEGLEKPSDEEGISVSEEETVENLPQVTSLEPLPTGSENIPTAPVEESVPPEEEESVAPAVEEPGTNTKDETGANDTVDGFRLSEKYPDLATGILAEAVLANLDSGQLLSSDDVMITEEMFEEELSRLSEEERKASSPFTFFVFEGMATKLLIDRQIQGDTNLTPQDAGWKELSQAYLNKITADAIPGSAEVEAYYQENREFLGEAPFDEVKEDIKEYLTDERRNAILEEYFLNFANEVPVYLHAPWVEEQVERFNTNEVNKARAAGKPLLVDFYAEWCGPCMQLKPTVEALEKEYADTLTVLFINVDEQSYIARYFKAESIPLLLFYDASGTLVTRNEGYLEKEQLKAELAKVGIQ